MHNTKNALAPAALAALILAAAVPATATAQVYKWIDANGKVQYSDRKPEDLPASNRPTAKSATQQVKLHVAPAPPPPSAAELAARRELDESRKVLAPPAPPVAAPPPAAAPVQPPAARGTCDHARNILDGLNRGASFNRPTDAHDKEMYANEVARLCGKG